MFVGAKEMKLVDEIVKYSNISFRDKKMRPLLDEIAEAMARTFYITTREHDPANNVGLEDTVEEYIKKWKDRFFPEAQAAIDVVERRLLSHETKIFVAKDIKQTIGSCAHAVIADTSVHAAWQAVKGGDV
jgi:hypothetical protein